MRLKSLYVDRYKNLGSFSLEFDDSSFIDVFVGRNGTGKSNLFEALAEIFRHLAELDRGGAECDFAYRMRYEVDGQDVEASWDGGTLTINGKKRKGIGQTPFPDHVLVYYSGHNDTVASLVARYEESFGRRIKRADFDEGRFFIGIGRDYKDLLMAVLLMQPDTCKARQFICEKLGIATVSGEVRVVLKRPAYATGSRFDIVENEETDRYWRPEGIAKSFLDRLHGCISTASGGTERAEGYFAEDDYYIRYFDIARLQQEFADWSPQALFRQFDNLKTLGMLGQIAVPMRLASGVDATGADFSDGQFQSVYIYSIVELFKDRSCITLLDEPDSFLHPEWQFEFLKQVFEITDSTAQNNHILMSSHSAVTLIPHGRDTIKFFDVKDDRVNCYNVPKNVAIKKLSADLISYSEQETLLSILNTVQIERKPVLFTEGSTDPLILKEAWCKLFDTEMPFIPFYAFSCSYMKQLLTDNRIHAEMGGLPVFALFDFDKAYDQWNGLNGRVLERDPRKGMAKKWAEGESYALMLPVPNNADIDKQVFSDLATGATFGGDSCCEIEHLFYGLESTKAYYRQEPCAGGSKIVFIGDGLKTQFAKQVVPLLAADRFEVLRPMFEFVVSKCPAT